MRTVCLNGAVAILIGVAVRTPTVPIHFSLRKVQALVALSLMLSLSAGTAVAQGNSGAMGAPALVQDQCKREVLAYQKNLETLRKNLGDKAAQEFADKFMTKEEWNDSLLRDGYCAIARGLKAHRLN
jgi:hypothetical protein